ncbi:hypothetical protein PHAVU_009G092000 [Phaseolus vulgaris]|uniref:Bifunctional inhibitor/plant lipid transfer protein/seed storage helical domain-containing protein n=1 Tax=Phaseolus vulgaris TaxID=3885 RepID=V7ATK8_PHAVU|nr:hypothetical protein PHAVU_009G092000g [Phaseolus vulgaris]ESW08997.1 hypothetical protein PHAVU_009G092000g [Phaseolus vulgaris]
MASLKLLPTIFLLSLISYSSFTQANCPPPSSPKPKPSPKPTPPTIKPTPSPKPTPPIPKPSPKASCPPPPTPSPSPKGSCPKDILKLGVCANVLGLVHVIVGTPPSSDCCALIKDLADLEAALCLCTAIKANVLGINLNVPVALSAILSACQKTVPSGFKCS